MKILSWNIERPKIDKKLDKNQFIVNEIKTINPDIIFLTETNTIIDFSSNYYKIQTVPLSKNYDNIKYYTGENRVTIFSKYKFVDTSFITYDPHTSISGKIVTPLGELILYGSIIGSFGGTDYRFKDDLIGQKEDIRKLSRQGNLCYSGDFNITFSDRPYPSLAARTEMNDFFKELKLKNTTEQYKNSVIHIVLTKSFIDDKNPVPNRYDVKNNISDHNYVTLDLEYK
jgi:endonuclease/exonuclease/phosphatase family metal-dependent hydrolase